MRKDVCRYGTNILGNYNTSFFEMHIDIHGEIGDITEISDENLSVFFHEYIHFLQDISTFTGMNSIYVYCEFIRCAVKRVMSKDEFDVPIPVWGNNCKVALDKWVNKVTCGKISNPCSDYFVKCIRSKTLKFTYRNAGLSKIRVYEIETLDGNKLNFGANAIMETMAYLMEQFCCPNHYSSPDYPYLSALQVAQNKCEAFADDKLNVLALCDCSLLTPNPAQYFIEFLYKVRDGEVRITRPEDVYDYLYYREKYNLQAFSQLANNVKALLKDYLNRKEFADYRNCVERFIESSIEFRARDKYRILRIAQEGDVRNNRTLGMVYTQLGTPIIENADFEYYNYQPGMQENSCGLEFLKAIRQIIRLFEEGVTLCEMYDWCVYPEHICDDRCLENPWNRVNDTKLCPYAAVWKHWGLSGKEPICE